MKDLNNIKWALKSSHPKFVEYVNKNGAYPPYTIDEMESSYCHFPKTHFGTASRVISFGYELITEQEFLEWLESQNKSEPTGKPKHPFEEEWYSKVSNDVQRVALECYQDELYAFNKRQEEKSKPMEKKITLIPFKQEVWEQDKTRKVYDREGDLLNIVGKTPDGKFIAWWERDNKSCGATTFLNKEMYFSQEDEPEMWVVIDPERIFTSKEKALQYARKFGIEDEYLHKIVKS